MVPFEEGDPLAFNLSWLRRRIAAWRGGTIEWDLTDYRSILAEINALESKMASAELQAISLDLRERAMQGAPANDLLIEAYALVREASRRVLGQRPFDVQVLGAIAMQHGKVVEMQTGEGKTLAAVMPVYLNALQGNGAHVLTFNDYLARRDAGWMGPIYDFLGLEVGFVQEGSTPEERKRAYAADVTYVTAKQAGFDLLRDSRALEKHDLVQRPFNFALVDEADSLLIDEARVPLVIAGSEEQSVSSAHRMAELVRTLNPATDFATDEYERNVWLTDAGIDRVEKELNCGSLFAEENRALHAELNCALHAEVLLHRDVDYIVREGGIQLVDEFTGRVVLDRHWPDGLQSALEAKEWLELRPEGRVLSSIPLQHFLRSYPKLCGMTGTAQDAAEELQEFYGLGVVVIPTNRPMIRVDQHDVVFTHKEAKEKAVVEEIARAHATGRPVLVGTLTVEESERLAAKLRETGMACEVLNAKRDELEARIVARAGEPGAVTISTNMAGRGTDIRLGAGVAALGGLYVIGTNRHESRRVDRQLRGRAGRQGDPGESRFFISLEDDLIVRFGVRRLLPTRLLPDEQDEPIENPAIRREIARAQRIIEGQNFDIRRELWRYSLQLERQRRAVQRSRRDLLLERTVSDLLATAAPERYAELVAAVGEEAIHKAERQVSLFFIDHYWSEYLAAIADLREGIHNVRAGQRDPLTEFQNRSHEIFEQLQDDIEREVLQTLKNAQVKADGIDLEQAGLKGPASTWTYLVNDDPTRGPLGTLLTGPGTTGIAVIAAAFNWWILIPWGIYQSFRKRRKR
jgi:preprotein translocase subunit SecA